MLDEPTAGFNSVLHSMKRVYIAESLADAQLVIGQLNEIGVDCFLFNENSGGALGELPATFPEVWVTRDRDQFRARELIAQTTSDSREHEIECSQCREMNPGRFEICWQCNQPLI